MTYHQASTNDAKLLADKIKDVRIAMMTTAETDGTMHSRPMATQEKEFDGSLWFFTEASAPKVGQVEQHRRLNLSYEKPEDNLFVSVSGTGQLVRDNNTIHDMWKPYYKAWFPKGVDDPDLALLKVDVEKAECWDAPSGKMGVLYSVAKGLASGGKDQGTDNKKIDFK